MEFKERFAFPSARVCISGFGKWGATIKYGKEKTNPTVLIFGVDEEFMSVLDMTWQREEISPM
jgi:hypothetical protein